MTHVNLSQVDKLLIASILPTRDIIGTLLPHNVTMLANMVSSHVREFAYFMDAQYTIAAKQALGRGGSVHARCHVYLRGGPYAVPRCRRARSCIQAVRVTMTPRPCSRGALTATL